MKLNLKHLLSNALKNFAPAAFLVPGVGPGLAAAIGGAGSALGQGLSRHPNLGSALKQGVMGAAEGYGGASLSGGQGYKGIISSVKGAFVPSSSATAGVPGATPSAGVWDDPAYTPGGSAVTGGMHDAIHLPHPMAPLTHTSFSTAPSLVGRIGAFAEKNPTALAMGLQGIGSMQTADSTNLANREMARRTAAETDTLEQERKRKAAQDAALEPLRRALAGQIAGLNPNAYKPAPNPYLS